MTSSLLLAALLVTTAAPADPWPHFRGGPAQTGRATGALPGELGELWTFQAPEEVRSSPVVGAAGRVYFGSNDGHLRAVTLAGGKPVWDADLGEPIEASPSLIGDLVIVGDLDGTLHARARADGSPRWRFKTGDKIMGAANHAASVGLVVVGSYDGKVYAVDARSGALRWTYTTDNFVHTSPAVAGDRAVVGGCDGKVHLIAVADGSSLGTIGIGAQTGSSVAMDGRGRAYLGHYGNQFLCLDTAAQSKVWTYEDRAFPYFSSAAVGDGLIVFGGRDKRLHAADVATGAARWTYRAKGKVDGSPIIVGDKVVLASEDGRLHVLALKDGAGLWSWDLGADVLSTPAVARGRVIVTVSDGRVVAFGGTSR